MPTDVPRLAFSMTVSAAVSVSEIEETALSLTSETVSVNVSCEVDPSVEVAVTVMSIAASVSASKAAPGATRTVPSGSTVKRLSSTV